MDTQTFPGPIFSSFSPGTPCLLRGSAPEWDRWALDGLSLDRRTLHFPGRTLLLSALASSRTGRRAAPLLPSWKQDWRADAPSSSFCRPCLGSTAQPHCGPLLPLKAEPCSKDLSWGQSPCRAASNSSLTSPAAEPFHAPRAPSPHSGKPAKPCAAYTWLPLSSASLHLG